MSHLYDFSTAHWSRIHGNALGEFGFKTSALDFIVTEQLSFEPSGSGEHVFLWVEKQNLNTAYVAEQLAKFAGVKLRDVTYAGRKDKYAFTRQWFGIHLANRTEPDWHSFELEGMTIKEITRNSKKLRTGAIAHNHFEIRLTDADDLNVEALQKRIELIKSDGVPNYFGEQRFGNIRYELAISGERNLPGNLSLAAKMLQGETIRNRNKASMAISAMRSWLFNEFIHERIGAFGHKEALPGDVLQLSGTQSFFLAENIDQTTKERLAERDVLVTCPLWGKGFVHSAGEVAKFENALADKHQSLGSHLSDIGLKQERRSMLLFPDKLQWKLEHGSLRLSFCLPPGCFATSVLRELGELKEP